MFQRLKTFVQTFTGVWVVIDRLEHNMVLQDRKIKLLEQRQDTLFDDVVRFMNKKKALEDTDELSSKS